MKQYNQNGELTGHKNLTNQGKANHKDFLWLSVFPSPFNDILPFLVFHKFYPTYKESPQTQIRASKEQLYF
jgi:hypothetical protein